MIEGLEQVNRVFKSIDLGISKRVTSYKQNNFKDMMEFSPEALDALNRSDHIYSDMQAELEPLKNLVHDALKEQYHLSSESEARIGDSAQELLDGYFSANNTADRIFGFAFSFYDGQSDRAGFAESMKTAIDKGFAQAEKMLGGLADISNETRDLIYQKIDQFVTDDSEEAQPAEQNTEQPS